MLDASFSQAIDIEWTMLPSVLVHRDCNFAIETGFLHTDA